MRLRFAFVIAALLFVQGVFVQSVFAQQWIRVNQVGYLPADKKVAVFISTEPVGGSVAGAANVSATAGVAVANEFVVCNAVTDAVVYRGKAEAASDAAKWGMKSAFRLDFSTLANEGGYYISFNGAKSEVFKIAPDVYDGLADYLLIYMRQQRCGYNPYNDAVCHEHDGYIVDHPTRSGEKIDVTGGWHDATDYLQYLTTSATTTYHMLFAYNQQKDKSVFKDE